MTSGVQNFHELRPRIIVMGVGGAGGNAVNNMIASGLEGVEFVAANTDAQALSMSGADVRFQLGANLTEGLGAGSNPEIGEGAAEEVLDEMRQLMEGAHMVFVACGMGGGTGTGAAPVVARVAQEMGVLTVAVVTKPFHFEGRRRMRIAEAGIEQLRNYVDTMIVIPNQNLFRLATEQTTFADSFRLADQVLNSGVSCVTDLIMKEGLINLDFADVKTVITEMGAAVMGTGFAHGENRAERAAEEAISNPLIDEISLAGAKGLLISISGGQDMTLFEVDEVASRIRREVDADANIIVGATFDDHLEGHLRVSLVASGLNHAHPKSMHEAADRLRMEADQAEDAKGLRENQAGLNERLKELETPEDHVRGPLHRAIAPQQRGHPPAGQAGYNERPGGPLPAGEAPVKGQVQIKNKPPRFMSDELSPRPGEISEPPLRDDMKEGRRFQPGAPALVQQPYRRMPRVDELPVTGQKQMHAYEAPPEPHGVVAQKKKVGFFDRLTGRRGNEVEESPAARDPSPEAVDEGAGYPAPHRPDAQRHDAQGYDAREYDAKRHDAEGNGDQLPGEQRPYVAQRPAVKGHEFQEPAGQIPPPPHPKPVYEERPPAEHNTTAEPDEDGWVHHRPKTPSERYPTYEVRKAGQAPIDLEEDDEMPVDIPPFLKKGHK